MKVIDNKDSKELQSKGYNYKFNKIDGYFERDTELSYSPYGPEILDLEITSGGNCLGKCDFCYKCNNITSKQINLSMDNFKIILDKVNQYNQLTQIAFGITNFYANKDFVPMMAHARSKGIIPNYTTHGLDIDEYAAKITKQLCGAVAVSINLNNIKNAYKALKSINLFNKNGMHNINIHYMLSKETYVNIPLLLRILKENNIQFKSIVFLQFKNKSTDKYHSVDKDIFKDIIKLMHLFGVSYGMDSCSAGIYLDALNDINPKLVEKQKDYIESCESSLFSSYINCKGEFFPCSFAEYGKGLDVIKCKNFIEDIWENEKTIDFRMNLIKTTKLCKIKGIHDCRYCPIYTNLR